VFSDAGSIPAASTKLKNDGSDLGPFSFQFRSAQQSCVVHASKSTGPRTPEGKAKVARNAYKGSMRLVLRELARFLRRPIKSSAD